MRFKLIVNKPMFKQQLNLFYIALGFLTRIPVPKNIDFSQQNLNQASRYFSAVGWIIGALTVSFVWLADLILPIELAILISMLLSVLLTGCFHEDGLADTCDGFGGGWLPEQKLAIMKDSRLGTYGATALWFSLSLKFYMLLSLYNINPVYLMLALLIAHPLSRAISTLMIFILPYVVDTDSSKVKPLAESHQIIDLMINLLIALLALMLVYQLSVYLIIALVLTTLSMRFLLLKQIQGFTGDTLGATQQVSELVIYLTLIIVGGTA